MMFPMVYSAMWGPNTPANLVRTNLGGSRDSSTWKMKLSTPEKGSIKKKRSYYYISQNNKIQHVILLFVRLYILFGYQCQSNKVMRQGGSRIVMGGGGGVQKIKVHTRITRAKPEVPCDQGPRPALEALRFFMLSCAISALFLHILIQNGIKTNVYNFFFLGGAHLLHPILNPPLWEGNSEHCQISVNWMLHSEWINKECK